MDRLFRYQCFYISLDAPWAVLDLEGACPRGPWPEVAMVGPAELMITVMGLANPSSEWET